MNHARVTLAVALVLATLAATPFAHATTAAGAVGGEPGDFRVTISASAGTAFDSAGFGVGALGNDSYNVGLDKPEPPASPAANSLQAYVYHPELRNHSTGGRLNVSILAPADERVWTLRVDSRSEAGATATLRWDHAETSIVGAGTLLELVHGGTRVDMKSATTHTFSVPAGTNTTILTVHLHPAPPPATGPSDTQAPNITAIAPTGTFVGLRPTFEVNASDDVGIANGSFRLDGAQVGLLALAGNVTFTPASADNKSGTLRWTPAADMAPGEHFARIVLADAAGNVAVREWSFALQVPPSGSAGNNNGGSNTGNTNTDTGSTTPTPPPTDGAAPTIGTFHPVGIVSFARPPITASFSDDVGVVGATLVLDGAAVPTAQIAFTPTSLSWTPSADLAAGPHSLRLAVHDATGKETSASWMLTIEISGNAPTPVTPTSGNASTTPTSATPTTPSATPTSPTGDATTVTTPVASTPATTSPTLTTTTPASTTPASAPATTSPASTTPASTPSPTAGTPGPAMGALFAALAAAALVLSRKK